MKAEVKSIANVAYNGDTAVYRKNISEVGSFEVVEVASAAVPRFIKRWHGNGLGWIAEPYQEKNGFTTIIAYYGSSTYSTAEMARLIDALISEAKAMGIETLPPDQLEALKASWKG